MDDFYTLESKKTWYTLLEDAKNDQDAKVFVQQLDCSISWARQLTDKTFDDVISISKSEKAFNHFVFIHRKFNTEYIEIGLATDIKDISYFIFIDLPIEKLKKYIISYGLILK